MNQHDRIHWMRLHVQIVHGDTATHEVYHCLLHNQMGESDNYFAPVSILDQENIPQSFCRGSRNSTEIHTLQCSINSIINPWKLQWKLMLSLTLLGLFIYRLSSHIRTHTQCTLRSIPVWLCQSKLHWECSESIWLAHRIWRPESVALYLYPSPSSPPWCCQCCEHETLYVHCSHSWQSHAHHSCSCYLRRSCTLSELFHCK